MPFIKQIIRIRWKMEEKDLNWRKLNCWKGRETNFSQFYYFKMDLKLVLNP